MILKAKNFPKLFDQKNLIVLEIKSQKREGNHFYFISHQIVKAGMWFENGIYVLNLLASVYQLATIIGGAKWVLLYKIFSAHVKL